MPTTLKNLKHEMSLKAGPASKHNLKSHRSILSCYYTLKTQPQRN